MTEQIRDWQEEFEVVWFGHTQTVPAIIEGSKPGMDLIIAEQLGPGKIYYFYYPLEEYPPDYWSLFNLQMTNKPQLRVMLSTAEELSNTIGIPVWERNIPGLWILSVEVNTINTKTTTVML